MILISQGRLFSPFETAPEGFGNEAADFLGAEIAFRHFSACHHFQDHDVGFAEGGSDDGSRGAGNRTPDHRADARNHFQDAGRDGPSDDGCSGRAESGCDDG